MLYLEDYLEMIEHLPQELRDRFTDMRELDLQVHNEMDSLEEQAKVFFSNAKRMKLEQRDSEFTRLKQEYYKTVDESDEKVNIANQIYDLVEKYLRRLDTELHKFKHELEADNAGITQLLEQRSLELDTPSNQGINHNRDRKRCAMNNVNSSLNNVRDLNHTSSYFTGHIHNNNNNGGAPFNHSLSINSHHLNNSVGSHNVSPSRPLIIGTSNPSSSSSSLSNGSSSQHAHSGGNIVSSSSNPLNNGPSGSNLSTLGYSNAIAAAASQAIVATQQMQQGRRTASLKASYEAINSGLQNISCDFGSNFREQLTASSGGGGSGIICSSNPSNVSASTSLPIGIGGVNAVAVVGVNQPSGSKGPNFSAVNSSSSSLCANDGFHRLAKRSRNSTLPNESDENGSTHDWNYDPNEPRYCLCNQVSYGDMVACDNENCEHEWFHYGCVGISQPPKGKWFCPNCVFSAQTPKVSSVAEKGSTNQMKKKTKKEKM